MRTDRGEERGESRPGRQRIAALPHRGGGSCARCCCASGPVSPLPTAPAHQNSFFQLLGRRGLLWRTHNWHGLEDKHNTHLRPRACGQPRFCGQPQATNKILADKGCTSKHSEPSYTPQTQSSTPAFSRGRLSAQNPHTVLSRICMKSDIKTAH